MSEPRSEYVGEANPRTMFLEGAYGAGKTTFAIETLMVWLEAGVQPENILVMVPQRTLARRYQLALRDADLGPTGDVQVRTLNGLAQDFVELYWPLVAEEVGFERPRDNPRFLTIETGQYAMSRFVEEAVERGEFDAVNVSPQEIARQVIDNLGKAALMGIDYHEVPGLLAEAWGPERPRKRILAYEAAGRVAEEFRQFCLQNRLLDYSLQLELFQRLLRREDIYERFLRRHTHLIAEHIEEESPLTHEIVRAWLPRLQGALLTYEWDGGYRVFLGADPNGGYSLRDLCDGVMTLHGSYTTGQPLEDLRQEIAWNFLPEEERPVESDRLGYDYGFFSYYTQMIDWVAAKIAHLVHEEGVPPRQIAVLAPFLSDALRFSLSEKLEAHDIKTISHRPSRALRDEPAARTLLTLTALAHPKWDRMPPPADVADALQHAIEGLDPVRAQLLAKIVYHRRRTSNVLTRFDQINPEIQSRITYAAGARYDELQRWLTDGYTARFEGETAPLDHFFSLLFGEVLSQPGYGFHDDPNAGRVTAEMVESARKFRQALYTENVDLNAVGRRYFGIVQQGLLAALYVASWRDELADAVFMAPAYTFLMRNRTVDVQFWLDVGSSGWWERLDQPLTHPYVLSPDWPPGEVWKDADEFYHQQLMLYRLMSGLVRRCRQHIYLGISDLGEQGFEQRGPMLSIFQNILRRHPQAPAEGAPRD